MTGILEFLNLLVFVLVFAAIPWFVWHVWLRKVVRARRIRQAGMERRMREIEEDRGIAESGDREIENRDSSLRSE